MIHAFAEDSQAHAHQLASGLPWFSAASEASDQGGDSRVHAQPSRKTQSPTHRPLRRLDAGRSRGGASTGALQEGPSPDRRAVKGAVGQPAPQTRRAVMRPHMEEGLSLQRRRASRGRPNFAPLTGRFGGSARGSRRS
eukprot:gene17010-biopygen5086